MINQGHILQKGMLFIFLGTFFITNAHADSSYYFYDLGTFGNQSEYPPLVNNAGQVFNFSTASRWNAITQTSDTFHQRSLSSIIAMNNHGSILYSKTTSGAIWFDDQHVTNFSSKSPLPTFVDINDSEHAVGYSVLLGKVFYWDGKTTQLFDGLTPATEYGNAMAYAMNNHNQIVGKSTSQNTDIRGVKVAHATLWDNGKAIDISPPETTNYRSAAKDINDAGDIIGETYIPTETEYQYVVERWIRHGDRVIDLRGPDGEADISAYKLNNYGSIVGATPTEDASFATLWTDDKATNLNLLIDPNLRNEGWQLARATDINDMGWITGIAYKYDDAAINGFESHGFLLTPEALTPAPLPASFWLLISAICALIGFTKIKRNETKRNETKRNANLNNQFTSRHLLQDSIRLFTK